MRVDPAGSRVSQSQVFAEWFGILVVCEHFEVVPSSPRTIPSQGIGQQKVSCKFLGFLLVHNAVRYEDDPALLESPVQNLATTV